MHAAELASQVALAYGVRILGAAVIAAVGLVAMRWIGAIVSRAVEERAFDLPVRHLIVGVVRGGIFILTLIAVLDKLGVQIAPLIAGLGVAGLGLGFALQGILGDLVAGLYIATMKPFDVGEYLELLGVQGQVVDIGLLATTLMPPDASQIVIPNKKIIGEILHRYGSARQLTLKVVIATGADLERALVAVREVVGASARVLKEPAPVTSVETVAADTVTIVAKPWLAIADWEAAQAELYPAIVQRLRRDGVPPFGAQPKAAA
jgi:small conductance mechanosensitive channel